MTIVEYSTITNIYILPGISIAADNLPSFLRRRTTSGGLNPATAAVAVCAQLSAANPTGIRQGVRVAERILAQTPRRRLPGNLSDKLPQVCGTIANKDHDRVSGLAEVARHISAIIVDRHPELAPAPEKEGFTRLKVSGQRQINIADVVAVAVLNAFGISCQGWWVAACATGTTASEAHVVILYQGDGQPAIASDITALVAAQVARVAVDCVDDVAWIGTVTIGDLRLGVSPTT